MQILALDGEALPTWSKVEGISTGTGVDRFANPAGISTVPGTAPEVAPPLA